MKKNSTLEVLKEAINNVDERYYRTTNPIERGGVPTEYSQLDIELNLEQKFVLELYHQMRLLIGKENLLEGEIYKRVVSNNDSSTLYKYAEKKKIKGIKPDLVLHRGQNINDPAYQLLALECKVGLKNNEFEEDFFKLMIYDDSLKFQNSVFLIVNHDAEDVRINLASYKENEELPYLKSPRIKILVKEKFGADIQEIL